MDTRRSPDGSGSRASHEVIYVPIAILAFTALLITVGDFAAGAPIVDWSESAPYCDGNHERPHQHMCVVAEPGKKLIGWELWLNLPDRSITLWSKEPNISASERAAIEKEGREDAEFSRHTHLLRFKGGGFMQWDDRVQPNGPSQAEINEFLRWAASVHRTKEAASR